VMVTGVPLAVRTRVVFVTTLGATPVATLVGAVTPASANALTKFWLALLFDTEICCALCDSRVPWLALLAMTVYPTFWEDACSRRGRGAARRRTPDCAAQLTLWT